MNTKQSPVKVPTLSDWIKMKQNRNIKLKNMLFINKIKMIEDMCESRKIS